MVITKTCEHPEEAAEFIFWMMQPENLAVYAYQNGMIPANSESLNVDPFQSDANWDIIRDYLSRAKIFVRPFHPDLIEFRDTVAAPTLMEVAEGKRTFADANALLEEQANEMLN
jgi:ABC-type glycerol-3-phosphate transport system substrate-binding protein